MKSSQGPKVVEKVDEGLDLWWVYMSIYNIYIGYIHDINICKKKKYIYICTHTRFPGEPGCVFVQSQG